MRSNPWRLLLQSPPVSPPLCRVLWDKTDKQRKPSKNQGTQFAVIITFSCLVFAINPSRNGYDEKTAEPIQTVWKNNSLRSSSSPVYEPSSAYFWQLPCHLPLFLLLALPHSILDAESAVFQACLPGLGWWWWWGGGRYIV